MKNNDLRYRKDIEKLNDILQTKEEYYEWYDKEVLEKYNTEEAYVIEPFPHKPFFLNWAMDVCDMPVNFRRDLSYKFFPFPEEVKPEEVKYDSEIDEFFHPDIKEGDSLVDWYTDNVNLSLHYSTNPKVWEWDWNRTVYINNKIPSEQLDCNVYILTPEKKFDLEKQGIFLGLLKKNGFQCKIKRGNGKF